MLANKFEATCTYIATGLNFISVDIFIGGKFWVIKTYQHISVAA